MNSNLVHNVLNVASLVLAAATAALIASGCTADVSGALNCSASWINPVYTTGAIAAVQVVKLAINVVRDGLGGLVKPQPPVQQ